jgi:hypothetical protein
MNTKQLVEVLDGMEEFDRVSTVRNPRLDPTLESYNLRASKNLRACKYCGHELRETILGLDPERQRGEVRIGDQLWKCGDCGEVRVWGWMEPWDSQVKPALHCDDCDGVTRHRFVRVA